MSEYQNDIFTQLVLTVIDSTLHQLETLEMELTHETDMHARTATFFHRVICKMRERFRTQCRLLLLECVDDSIRKVDRCLMEMFRKTKLSGTAKTEADIRQWFNDTIMQTRLSAQQVSRLRERFVCKSRIDTVAPTTETLDIEPGKREWEMVCDSEITPTSKLAGPLQVYIDSDAYTPEEKGELLSLISDLYFVESGDRLVIDSTGMAESVTSMVHG